MSVYGACTEPSDALQIVQGYSRDRIGAKQIQFGLSDNEDGIPFYGDVHDENQSDKEWNPEVFQKVHEQFQRAKLDAKWMYVVDSAAMTQPTLKQAKAAKAFLINRGPNYWKLMK